MKDGIINVYKEKDMTSNDVIGIMKIILRIKKLGHTGTLDPMATGVLPVLINRGTRVAEYMDVDFKTYKATMILGCETDTYDVTGEVLEVTDEDIALCEEEVKKKLNSFLGLIDQMPPMYSAVRINGRKLYRYMHEAPKEEIESVLKKVKPRQVYIKDVLLVDMGYMDKGQIDYPLAQKLKDKVPYITFKVTCSKGTYIRTICHDLGNALGTCGTMLSLERTEVGVFKKENSIKLSELRKLSISLGLTYEENGRLKGIGELKEDIPDSLMEYVFPLDYPLTNFGEVVVKKDVARKFIDGWHLSYNEVNVKKEPSYIMPIEKEELRDAVPTSSSNHHGSYPGLKVHPEYKKAYKIYDEEGVFLGVAFHNDQYKKLVADKVLVRNDSYK